MSAGIDQSIGHRWLNFFVQLLCSTHLSSAQNYLQIRILLFLPPFSTPHHFPLTAFLPSFSLSIFCYADLFSSSPKAPTAFLPSGLFNNTAVETVFLLCFCLGFTPTAPQRRTSLSPLSTADFRSNAAWQ